MCHYYTCLSFIFLLCLSFLPCFLYFFQFSFFSLSWCLFVLFLCIYIYFLASFHSFFSFLNIFQFSLLFFSVFVSGCLFSFVPLYLCYVPLPACLCVCLCVGLSMSLISTPQSLRITTVTLPILFSSSP